MKKLYSFFWDCGRQGSVTGLFIEEEDEVHKVIGKEVYFGEILGKHSEIFGTLEESDFTVKTDDQPFIERLLDIIGSHNISGHNPLDYLQEDEETP